MRFKDQDVTFVRKVQSDEPGHIEGIDMVVVRNAVGHDVYAPRDQVEGMEEVPQNSGPKAEPHPAAESSMPHVAPHVAPHAAPPHAAPPHAAANAPRPAVPAAKK